MNRVFSLSMILVWMCAGLASPAQEESPTALSAPGADADRSVNLALKGLVVTPHLRAAGLRFSETATEEGPLGARLQFFVHNASNDSANEITFDDVSFDRKHPLLEILDGRWSWADTPNEWPGHERRLPAGAMSVWTINVVKPAWNEGDEIAVRAVDWSRIGGAVMRTRYATPDRWLSAVTFLGATIHPARMVVHVTNDGLDSITLKDVRLWMPKDRRRHRVLFPGESLAEQTELYPSGGRIPAGEKGMLVAETGELPLTYAAVEVTFEAEDGTQGTLWGHVRVKAEAFDIAGGWINGQAADGRSVLLHEPFLKTMMRLYVNSAHIGVVAGYNDAIGSGGLYDRYPIKFFGPLQPIAGYDTVEKIPHVHGVEFLGEPQLPFGGRLPQEVYREFLPYRPTQLATTITLSDERTFRHYAGLSDYPHYDAYRVIAPSADSWRHYERWGAERIGWGSPLETIGDLSRVLRDMSRPMPTALWSQGPHDGWYMIDGRRRLSPTPDELLVQAYHGLSSRVTSLYWFNLSLRAVAEYRDTLAMLTRIGREMRMLEDFYLAGDAYEYTRILNADGGLDWDLASIAAPEGVVLFALDLDYAPDPHDKVFVFGPPRDAVFAFTLPPWLGRDTNVFRVDADGVYDVTHTIDDNHLTIRDTRSKVGIYVAAADAGLRQTIEARRQSLVAAEDAIGFDPANNDADFAALEALLPNR